MAQIIRREKVERGTGYPPKYIPVVRCNCGEHVECSDGWANACDTCGTEYNGSGQELSPRIFWGEETGEAYYEFTSLR